MWKKNLVTIVRRRRFHVASKSPSLATIPEDSTSAHSSQGSSLSDSRRLAINMEDSTLAHSSQGSSLSDSHHRPRIKARDCRLRICFLILLPMYIITTTLLIRALQRYDSGIGQTLGSLKSFESNGNRMKRGMQKNQKIHHKTMVAGRVVYLSINNDFNIDRLSRSRIESITNCDTCTMKDDNQLQDEKMSSRQYNTNRNQNDNQSQDGESPYHQINTKGNESCEPMAKWQSMSFPTCNSLHEMNVFSATPYLALRSPAPVGKFKAKRTTSQHNIIQDTYSAKLLGNGWFRDAWKVSDVNNSSFAFKTLRLERDFVPEYFELHRRDSVALERLTESPYVMVSVVQVILVITCDTCFSNIAMFIQRISTDFVDNRL